MRRFALTVLAIAALGAAAVHAAPAPGPKPVGEIDFSTVLTDQDEQPIMDCKTLDKTDERKCAEQAPLTLSRVAVGALLNPDPSIAANGTEQMRRWLLAKKLYKGGLIVIDDGERDLLKTQIARRQFPIAVMGRAWEILDPQSARK